MTMGFGGNNPWLLFLLMGLLAVISAVIGVRIRKPSLAYAGRSASTRSGYLQCATATYEATKTSKPSAAGTEISARFLAAGGGYVSIPANVKNLGRDDFWSFVVPGKVSMISRDHLRVDFENGEYYIEDLNSTNGTRINGSSINDKGRCLLNDGDLIELAGILTITFKT